MATTTGNNMEAGEDDAEAQASMGAKRPWSQPQGSLTLRLTHSLTHISQMRWERRGIRTLGSV